MNLSSHRLTRALALVTILTLLTSSIVVADDMAPDGDGPTAVNFSGLNFGNVCAGQTYVRDVPIYIQRAWPAANIADQSRTFNGGSPGVTFSFASPATNHANLSALLTDTNVILPADWRDTSVWTQGQIYSGDSATVRVTLTPTVTGTGIVNLTAAGLGGNLGTSNVSRTIQDLKVDWTLTTVGCDSTPPVITPTITGTLGNNGWYTSNVTVTFSVADAQSAVSSKSAHCDATNQVTADTTGVTFTCTATSAGGTDSVAVTIKRDATNPSVALVGGPAAGVKYTLGSVPAAPTCSASDATSGLAGPCAVTGYSTALGSHTVTASATDNAGNQGSDSRSYSVIYAFDGFFQPIDNAALNSLKAGQAVPIKFSLGGDQGLNIFATGFPKSQKVTCDSSVGIDPVEETVTAGSSSLSYDSATGTYNYVWKTEKAWAGTCRQLTVQLADGESYTALFRLNK